MRKTFSSSVLVVVLSVGSSKVALSLLLARVAAWWSNFSGYFRRRKCLQSSMTVRSKSSLNVQIRLILRNWLYGMLSLHLCGCAEL